MNSKSLKSTLAVAALGWTSTASAAAWGTVAYKKADIPLLGCGACILAGLSYTSNTDDAWKVYVGYGAYPQKNRKSSCSFKEPSSKLRLCCLILQLSSYEGRIRFRPSCSLLDHCSKCQQLLPPCPMPIRYSSLCRKGYRYYHTICGFTNTRHRTTLHWIHYSRSRSRL